MIRYEKVLIEPDVFYTMLTVPITETLEVVHCLENYDTTVLTDSEEFELKWSRDIFELVVPLVNAPVQKISEIIQQLQLKEKQMLS
ncbi:MAG: hypothetical protein KBT36_10295 [Kurthia sp.]|nr:hypothetical protein [Candidatus Kurthia equi]